ncbi:hypothetical protein BJ166DRAFT_514456 [Pestalotiopsis sp. NC0098]|nr:hypothetical protein BJ166DRAFT_514456 [Pestalotiopsis sp. NC0098]
MDLQIEAEASADDRCLTISFSHSLSAVKYHRYLSELKDMDPAFLHNHDWKFTHKPNIVSVILPESVEIRQSPPYGVELSIQNVELADAWEAHMLLWNGTMRSRDLPVRCFTLAQPATVTDFEDKIRRARNPQTTIEIGGIPRENTWNNAHATSGQNNAVVQSGILINQNSLAKFLSKFPGGRA